VPAGCKLIDQRTFERAKTAPTGAALTRGDLPARPLVVIDFAFADADWRAPLDEAVRSALLLNANARFAVVTPIPTGASQAEQDKFAKQGQADAQMIANQMQTDGVTPERISLRFQGDPGSPTREVRVYTQ